MTDCVRLYVFDCQNFVSEKDYRVAMRNYSIRDADADRLQAQVDRMTVELYRAREAGRREGLEEACAAACAWCKLGSPAVLKGGIWQHLEEHDLSAGTCRAWRIRALIDSPEVE